MGITSSQRPQYNVAFPIFSTRTADVMAFTYSSSLPASGAWGDAALSLLDTGSDMIQCLVNGCLDPLARMVNQVALADRPERSLQPPDLGKSFRALVSQPLNFAGAFVGQGAGGIAFP